MEYVWSVLPLSGWAVLCYVLLVRLCVCVCVRRNGNAGPGSYAAASYCRYIHDVSSSLRFPVFRLGGWQHMYEFHSV